jgi:hypothetical protein
VVFGHRVRPLTKPPGEGSGELRAFEGVVLDPFPLSVVEGARFVQDLRMNRDLSNVVQKCRPTKAIPIDLRQLHLFGDQVGVHSHAFAVAPGSAIVDVERAGQHQNLFRGDDRRVAHAVVFRLLYSPCQIPGTSGLARHGHSFRGLVWKHQCHLQQHGEWKQSARQAIGHGQHDQWRAQH